MEDLQKYLDNALSKVTFDNIKEESHIEDYNLVEEIAELVISVRTSAGLTQKQLAEKSGVSQANISKIENGSYLPSLPILKRMTDALEKRIVINIIDIEEGF